MAWDKFHAALLVDSTYAESFAKFVGTLAPLTGLATNYETVGYTFEPCRVLNNKYLGNLVGKL